MEARTTKAAYVMTRTLFEELGGKFSGRGKTKVINTNKVLDVINSSFGLRHNISIIQFSD